MPGDIGRIPIISLSGCKYLTNIINELPLPKSTNLPIRCHTLLSDQNVAQEAYRCINCQNDALVGALIKAFSKVNNDVQFKEKSSDQNVDSLSSPLLLRTILDKNPGIFSDKIHHEIPPHSDGEGPSTSSYTVSSNSAVNGLTNSNKQKIRKTKSEGVTYNATTISKAGRSTRRKNILNNSSSLPDAQNKDPLEKTETCHEQTSSQIHTSHDLCNNLSSQVLSPAADSKQKSPIVINTNISRDSDEAIEESSKLVASTAAISLDSKLNPVVDQIHSTSKFLSNTLINDPSKVEVSQTDHAPKSPYKSNQFWSTGCDTNPIQPRRIPDPALSQIFHSVALFHTYQPTCEPDKGIDSQGGGLFDDWVDTPKLSESPSFPALTVPNKCISSLTPVSSVSIAVKENSSVGASNELMTGLSRSPQSVLSNCSYPTTPGGNVVVALHNTTSAITISTSSVTSSVSLSKGAYTQVATPSSTRLFDSVDETLTTNLSTCSALDEQVSSTPHGLAAYLPRCNNQRPLHPTQTSVFPNEDVPVTSANSVSPKSALSPAGECIDLSSVSPLESGARTPGSSRMTVSTVNDPISYSKSKPNVRGRISVGKPRGGGRRRRTELEELKRWSVIDHANPGLESKITDLFEIRDSPQNSTAGRDSISSLIPSEATIQSVPQKRMSHILSLPICAISTVDLLRLLWNV
ncbi:unnamed protein product [Heterobilharzia americana]|nr:unnamed protein product [Heterobilharzia americana]